VNEFVDGYLGGTFNGKEVLGIIAIVAFYFWRGGNRNAR
jgi:hypothetical protein